MFALGVPLGPALWEEPPPWPFQKLKGGSVLPPGLTGPALSWITHCPIVLCSLQPLIPGPVLSQLFPRSPWEALRWTLLAQAWDGGQRQLWVALFSQHSFQGSA